MLRLLLLISICLLSSGSLWGTLVFEDTRIRIETRAGIEKVQARFEFENQSNRTVSITGTKTTCGCTAVPAMNKRIFAPGESGEIAVEFTLGSRKGLQKKSITVQTDERNLSGYVLELEVDIAVPFSITPQVLRWKKGEGSESKQVMVTLSEGTEVLFKSEELEGFVFSKQVLESGEMVLTIQPSSESGRRVERLTLFEKKNDGSGYEDTLFLMQH